MSRAPELCYWTPTPRWDDMGGLWTAWETECKGTLEYNVNPRADKMFFCCFCGGRLYQLERDSLR